MTLGSKSRTILCGLVTLGWLVGCSDTGGPCPACPAPANSVIVSNPNRNPAAALSPLASISITGDGDGAAYVSLSQGTVPGGNIATIQNRRTGATETAVFVFGGFDPVAIPASPGDTLDLDIQLFDGGQVHLLSVVPSMRPPIIVRTDPPPKKRDVPLNAAVLIVFSEPIDSTTITAVGIYSGSTRVPAHLELRDSGLKVVLVPDALLDPNSDYILVVTAEVRDQSGDPLEAPLSVTFTTAASASVSSQIAFQQLAGGGGTPAGIYAINPDGTGTTLLVDAFNDGTGEPAWSPDGRRLAFVSRRHQVYGFPGDLAVYVMNADGSGLARLTNSPAPDEWPAWSPDGTKIAFNRFTCLNPDCTQQGYRAVYTVNVDGTGLTRLTDPVGVGEDEWPTWSPDGTKIAFVRSTDTTASDVYVMNADGSNMIRLTDGQHPVRTPAWSPDGLRIAFSRAPFQAANPDFDLYIMNADGSHVRQLTNGPSADWSPSWSPDGQRLVFYSEGRDPVQSIFIIGADGSGLTRVTDNPYGVTAPNWSHAPSR